MLSTVIKVIFLMKKVYWRLSDSCVRFYIQEQTNVTVGGKLRLLGTPIVQIDSEAKLLLGDNITLNSRNFGYHANMMAPVKLMADRPGALIQISSNTRINGACIHAYKSIKIGQNCLIAANVQIIDANGHELSFESVENRVHTSSEGYPIVIEDNVWIGINSIILPGVSIGKGSVIAANTVVTKNVPEMVVYGGNPGRIIKEFKSSD